MGVLIGTLVVIMRAASSFAGGVFSVILFTNTFTPLADGLIKQHRKRETGG